MTEGEGSDPERYRDGYFTVTDGLRLHYRDYPGNDARPPLLCLPGLTRNARDFTELAELYSPRFRVLVLEFRGRGESDYDPLPARYNPMVYAADVLQFLDRLKIDQAIFVGTSLGGLVTMVIATLAPQRIAGAVLNDVGPELNHVGLDRIQSYVGRDERFRSWDEAADEISRRLAPAFPNYDRDDWIAMARRNCREENGEIRFDYDMAIAEPFQTAGPTPAIDGWPFFAALAQKPLLMVRGAISELLSASASEKMRAAAPKAQFVEVPDIGHAPMLNEPEAAAAVADFLGSLASTVSPGEQSEAG
jgi:pimeloyl-ACP methyl ester carboxylesterase